MFTRGFTIIWMASLLYNAAFQLVGAALPLHAVTLGAGDAQVGLLFGLFALAAMAARTVVGWQLDRGTKRRVLVAGNLVFVVSALGYATVSGVGALLALRVLNGAGHAAGQAANQTLATEAAPPVRRGEALAMQHLTLTLALGTMPALGVALGHAYGYQTLFVITAVVSGLATVVAMLCPEPPPPATRPPPRFFNLAVVRPGLILLTLMVPFGAVAALAPVHAGRVGLSNPGFFFLTFAGGLALGQSFGGRLSDRRGRGAAIVPGLVVAGIGMAAVAVAYAWWLLPAGALFGLGVGFAQPSLFALAVDHASPQERGSALATAGIFLEAGISLGATLAGVLAQIAGLATAFVALGLLPALAVLSLVATAWGRRTLRPPVSAIAGGR